MPSTFSEDDADGWNFWVLRQRLPELPDTIDKGESVPVARWVGPTCAAVLRVEWMWGEEDLMNDCLGSYIQVFRHTHNGWEASLGDGGGSWFEPPLQRPAIGGREIRMGGVHISGGEDWTVGGYWGYVGNEIATVDVFTSDGVVARPIESTIGAVVVAFDATIPTTFQMSDLDGAVVRTMSYDPDTFEVE